MVLESGTKQILGVNVRLLDTSKCMMNPVIPGSWCCQRSDTHVVINLCD